MRLIRSALCVGLAGFLVACASPRPQAGDAEYAAAAHAWVAATKCGEQGLADPNTASLAQQYVRAAMGRYTYSESQLAMSVRARQDMVVTQQSCNKMAMDVSGQYRQIQANNAMVDKQEAQTQQFINSTRPVNTQCNRIGSQVFCNSF